MAGKRRIDEATERALIEAYQAWDPTAQGSKTISDLVSQFGVTKQTLYAVLARNGVALKSGAAVAVAAPTDGTWRETTSALLGMLVDCRMKVAELERLLDEAGIAH